MVNGIDGGTDVRQHGKIIGLQLGEDGGGVAASHKHA
jgi:hypothetical protein